MLIESRSKADTQYLYLKQRLMKNRFIPLVALTILFKTGIGQELKYTIRHAGTNWIKKERLNEARFMNEINPYQIGRGLTSFVSTEIRSTYDDKVLTATGTSDTLTEKQKNLLKEAPEGAVITVNFKYKFNDKAMPDNNYAVSYSTLVIPDVDAEYSNNLPPTENSTGWQQLHHYLKTNTIDKLSGSAYKKFSIATVKFTVNEKGEIENAKMTLPSEDKKIDQLLLDVFEKMPKWKPAENSKGEKIKQDFEFSVGTGVKPIGC